MSIWVPSPPKYSDGEAAGRSGSQASAPCRDRPIVLVVDDDADDRQIYGMMLCYNGFDVAFASSNATGVQAARRYRPDLVLLDLGLPDGHGLDLCTEVRSWKDTADVPVLVLSGFRETELGEAARRAGCTAYIEKPANPIDVMHRVEEIVGTPPLAGEGRPPRVLE